MSSTLSRNELVAAAGGSAAANFSSVVAAVAALDGDRVAVRHGDRALTYAQVDDLSARMATLLRGHGVDAGARVGLMLPNREHVPVAYHAVLRAGGAVVPMNILLKEREAIHYLGDSEARCLVAWHGLTEGVAAARACRVPVIEVDPDAFLRSLSDHAPLTPAARSADDTAVVLYSSGTTGRPKGVELTHGNLSASSAMTARSLDGLLDGAVVFTAAPLFHGYGQGCGLNAALRAGASLTLLERFDAARALEVIERDRVTVFQGVPTMFHRMLRCPDLRERDLTSLRACMSGGAAMAPALLLECERAFGCQMLEGYGISEGFRIACNPPGARKPASVGLPLPGVEVRLVDSDGVEVAHGEVGEVVVHGPNVMKGYWRRPEDTARAIRDGWLQTGDMARVDEDGYLFIVGRKKDVIIRGGYNVYPREIEQVLCQHPAVVEAAVVGIPDEEMGEEVAAAVVLATGHTVSPDELTEHARRLVAAYKYPRIVWIVDALPRGFTGKVLRDRVRADALGRDRTQLR